jgi:enoyl-CoA hydratase
MIAARSNMRPIRRMDVECAVEGAMGETLVRYENSDGIVVITMDDGKANAIGHAMIEQLHAALTRAEEGKAIVLTGREGRFSGGFDLKVMMSGLDAARTLVSAGAELLLRLYELPKPVVAACTGHAIAAGALMLLSTDTRIGADGPFKVGLNETAIGMTLPLVAQELARDRLDPRRLTEATIQATTYAPVDAREVGYLDRVVSPGALAATAHEHATALARLAPSAYAATKARLRRETIDMLRRTLAFDLAELTAPG